jgi:hypothetical protein
VIADLIEAHLDQLLAQLRGSATDVRRILSEAEEHLRDATAELVAVGASEEEAQRLAIERFGDPRTVARRFSARLAPVPPAAVAGELVRAAVLLGTGSWPATCPGDLYRAALRRVPGVLPRRRRLRPGGRAPPLGEVVEYRVVVGGVLGLLILGGSCCGAADRTDRTRGTWASFPTGSRQQSRPACTAWPRASWPC